MLKSTAYAYLRMGIPMILGFPLVDTGKMPNEFMGKHAVSLTGYSLPSGDPKPYGPSSFNLKANRIDKLYVHDDQVGPFARMIFDGKVVTFHGQDGNPIHRTSVSTSWAGSNKIIGSARAIPELLLVPLYHKIRIPFGSIHDQIMELDPLIKYVFSKASKTSSAPNKYEYEWDIYLSTVNEVKSEYIKMRGLDPSFRAKILTSGMPKYIWRATVKYGEDKILDVLFDATDIEQGAYVINVVVFCDDFAGNLRGIVAEPSTEQAFRASIAWPIIEWIKDSF